MRRNKAIQNQRYRARKYKAVWFAFFVIVIAFIIYFISQIEPVQKKYIYPYPHQDLVTLYAEANGVPPALVASVIKHESKFLNDVHSSRGAIGLMQIMPETAEWIAGELEDPDFNLQALHDPEMNIRYGTWYLALLTREFNDNQVLALAAYNAGRGIVHAWMEEYEWSWDFKNTSLIPYPETRLYVERVLKDKHHYEILYHLTTDK